MVLIYHKEASWEKDYICKEIFSGIKTREYSTEQLLDVNTFSEELQHNNILAFSSNSIFYEEALNLAKQLKPKIIVHLSDEYGTRNIYQKLSKHTSLLLRQHNHFGYVTSSNIMVIPLGYGTGMLKGQSSKSIETKPILERKLNWSFIGNLEKEDRHYMLESMRRMPHNLFTDNFSTSEMKDVYLDSIFVPCGRGGHKLDCFRLYEASICGAIPIVVGIEREIEQTFVFEHKPPWLFARNWEEAYIRSNQLLSYPERLIEIQREILFWWRKTNENILIEINKVL